MSSMNRREFLSKSAKVLAFSPLARLAGCDALPSFRRKETPAESVSAATPSRETARPAGEAMYYDTLPGDTVQCSLCFRECVIASGARGAYRVRENRDGKLYSLVYGTLAAVNVDPVEKQPIYHVMPGSLRLCIGTAGCNFFCRNCHNWRMSQRSPEEMARAHAISPAQLVSDAVSRDIRMISYTYNEPTSFYEYMLDTSELAKEHGMITLCNSNGAMNPEPLGDLLKVTDAFSIDLKGFTGEFYKTVSSARIEPVLRNLPVIKQAAWLELVNLVIPTYNDDMEDIRGMCRWIVKTLGADTPLHFSRFTPAYRLTQVPPTPVRTLETAYGIAIEEGLEYVSIGNVPGHRRNSTFCPACGERMIHRRHFRVLDNRIENGKCGSCGHPIPGIWKTKAIP